MTTDLGLPDGEIPDRDFMNVTMRQRVLTPAQCRAVADARARGVPAATLARKYGVNRRTIYRALAYADCEWMRVRVGDWHAEFVITADGPVRCTAWMAAR